MHLIRIQPVERHRAITDRPATRGAPHKKIAKARLPTGEISCFAYAKDHEID
jgi:hypothetical protein